MAPTTTYTWSHHSAQPPLSSNRRVKPKYLFPPEQEDTMIRLRKSTRLGSSTGPPKHHQQRLTTPDLMEAGDEGFYMESTQIIDSDDSPDFAPGQQKRCGRRGASVRWSDRPTIGSSRRKATGSAFVCNYQAPYCGISPCGLSFSQKKDWVRHRFDVHAVEEADLVRREKLDVGWASLYTKDLAWRIITTPEVDCQLIEQAERVLEELKTHFGGSEPRYCELPKRFRGVAVEMAGRHRVWECSICWKTARMKRVMVHHIESHRRERGVDNKAVGEAMERMRLPLLAGSIEEDV